MSECADRDAVDAGFGDAPHRCESDAAGGFRRRLPVAADDGVAQHVERHVVQQDPVGPGSQGLVDLLE
jgi:hypothetical protein